jgi:carbon monoxide dehydrogenase subunit G
VGRPVPSLIRLAFLSALAAWVFDRWLRGQDTISVAAPIRTSISISAPIEKVWAILADIERQPEWMHDLKSVKLLTPLPVGIGTQATGRVQAFGIAVEDPVAITAFEAPTHFALRHEGVFKGSGDIRLTSEPDGWTVITWDEVLVPPVLPYLGRLVVGVVFRPIFQRDLERLAGLAERL